LADQTPENQKPCAIRPTHPCRLADLVELKRLQATTRDVSANAPCQPQLEQAETSPVAANGQK
jgi:hypothetical protein